MQWTIFIFDSIQKEHIYTKQNNKATKKKQWLSRKYLLEAKNWKIYEFNYNKNVPVNGDQC